MYKTHIQYIDECTADGDYLRPFLPLSEVENKWLLAYCINVSPYYWPVRGYHVNRKKPFWACREKTKGKIVTVINLTELTESTLARVKGVVDKIKDVVDNFHAHIRTQEGRLPKKIS